VRTFDAIQVELQAREIEKKFFERDTRLGPGEMGSEAVMRPDGESHVALRIFAIDIKFVRIVEKSWVAVGCAEHAIDGITLPKLLTEKLVRRRPLPDDYWSRACTTTQTMEMAIPRIVRGRNVKAAW
jgi:hypothetical protein